MNSEMLTKLDFDEFKEELMNHIKEKFHIRKIIDASDMGITIYFVYNYYIFFNNQAIKSWYYLYRDCMTFREITKEIDSSIREDFLSLIERR